MLLDSHGDQPSGQTRRPLNRVPGKYRIDVSVERFYSILFETEQPMISCQQEGDPWFGFEHLIHDRRPKSHVIDERHQSFVDNLIEGFVYGAYEHSICAR